MNPKEGGYHAGGSNEDVEADEAVRDADERHINSQGRQDDEDGDVMVNNVRGISLADELDSVDATPDSVGQREFYSYGEDVDAEAKTPPPGSPAESSSIPDDTPSLAGSLASLHIRKNASSSPRGSVSRTPSGALQPFERRFQSRFSASPSHSSTGSPAFLRHSSRQSSISGPIASQDGDVPTSYEAPWEVVRWTKLRKIAGQAFSEIGKRQFGTPTCLAVSASIVIGTSKGLILIFDYHQALKSIIGQGTKAAESGAITSLTIAADYSTVAGGHATGNIFTWEIARPAKPFLHISPSPRLDEHASSDGHVPGRAVLHVGFLGTRHTALVSADDGGMAFSHLATRGLGAVARSVKTTRLLGRYPSIKPEEDLHRKPSSVLAFSSLPLGNVEQATDNMGLTALLTPYLLVVVSTTPVAQTQHKASRPKEINAHGAMSGCLAWFPAVRLKTKVAGKEISQTKLVYCWSEVLTVLDVEIGKIDPSDGEKQPSLFFHQRARWKCEEAIVAVQWLSRSVIGVLTISQRLVIIEDGDLHVMDSVDLLRKHIYHRDFYSNQLQSVVEQSENDSYIHGVVADAYYMSFRTYKSRLFLLGFSDVSVGTLSNWADRIAALVEHGNDIAAIRLAMSYYMGTTGKVSVGLPEDEASRHEIIQEKLLELMSASLRVRLSEKTNDEQGLRELVTDCFEASIITNELSFLLDDIYDMLDDSNKTAIFLDMLEAHIMEGDITALPPTIVKDLVVREVVSRHTQRLEEMLCRLDAHTFDIDQVTRLCKQNLLYDALIYVWNQALSDWTTPLVELLTLIRDLEEANGSLDHDLDDRASVAMKVFPYLAFSLTGRMYPKDEFMDDEQADSVKREVYNLLFSGQATTWPPGSSTIIRTKTNDDEEPAFPYLRLLLGFDCASFMSMLNEAFEDPYLNAGQDQGSESTTINLTNGSPARITRQQIISILLETMSQPDFASEQTIYLDIFIARSLPKYSQFMILSGSSLQQVLHRLCSPPYSDVHDECQLSVEYLLSVYHPPVNNELISLLHDVGFYRVLKSVYRNERRYVDLIRLYFEDQHDQQDIFTDLVPALRSEASWKQSAVIKELLCQHATQLAFIDLSETARILSTYLPSSLSAFLDSLGESRLRFALLRELLEPGLNQKDIAIKTQAGASKGLVKDYGEQYVQLMCSHDPTHVADYVRLLETGNLKLDRILPSMEENGVIDAAVMLLAQDGLARDAMERLTKHLQTLQNVLCSLIEASSDSPDAAGSEEAMHDMIDAIEKYVKLGIWLCQGQSKVADHKARRPQRSQAQEVQENDLELDEFLWLNLIDQTVNVTRDVSTASSDLPAGFPQAISSSKATISIRALVQQVFTALLTTTTTPAPKSSQKSPSQQSSQTSHAFLLIFRAFLTRAAKTAPSLSDLRAVLSDIFTAYAYESDVLTLASQLLGKDIFAQIAEVHALRQQGWRPRAQVCERCKRRAWGGGIGEGVWDSWIVAEEERGRERRRRIEDRVGGQGRGKGREVVALERSEEMEEERKKMVLVVFACKHVFHRQCLDGQGEEGARLKCPLCDKREGV